MANISISVAAVNDAPVIDSVTGPSEVDGRSSTTFTVTAHDVEGDPVVVSVQQLGGGMAQLVMSGNTFSVHAPDSQAVDILALRVSASDGTASSDRDMDMRVLPISASGSLRTVRGSRDGQGLHLVVTGDGYTAAEQALLRADARMLASAVVDATDVGMYSAAWNVHVLDQASAESGVDFPTQGIVRNTAFDGTLDCYGVQRPAVRGHRQGAETRSSPSSPPTRRCWSPAIRKPTPAPAGPSRWPVATPSHR